MEENQPNTGKFGLTYGALLGGITVIFGLILYSLDMHYERGWTINLVNFLIMASVISLAIVQFKKACGGYISLGQAMKVGLATALIAGIISIVWQMVFINVIEPEFMDKIIEISKAEMIEQNPNMTDEQIAQGEGMIKMFTGTGAVIIMTLVASLFFGSIISLVTGLIVKKQKPE
ncbi:MAG: DUF4199 domain-containing protein [Maribacter sp.]|nr:DUF4199 domain-containing protein [Maribacter sp.]